MDVDWLSVADAAARLKVGGRQVRRLINDGLLPAKRVPGGAWMVDPVAVSVRAAGNPSPGQPLSPVNAWRFVHLAAAADPDDEPSEFWPIEILADLSREERRRLMALLKEPAPVQLARLLRRRAVRTRVSAHRSIAEAAATDSRVWFGGAAAVAAQGGGLAAGGRLRIYVRERDRAPLSSQYRLRPDAEGEVDLLAVPSVIDERLLPPPARFVPLALGWIDCLDESDSRARHGAAQWARRLSLEKVLAR